MYNSFTSEKYKVKMVLECANSTSPKLVNDGTFDESSCTNTINIQTKEGILYV